MSVDIEIAGVSHAYKTSHGLLPVLEDLNLSIRAGDFTAVVGPSGVWMVRLFVHQDQPLAWLFKIPYYLSGEALSKM